MSENHINFCHDCESIERQKAVVRGFLTRKIHPIAQDYSRMAASRENRIPELSFPFANDATFIQDFVFIIKNIIHALNSNIRYEPQHITSQYVAVIVGNAYILSLISKINIDEFWICDIDPLVFTVFKVLRRMILASEIPPDDVEMEMFAIGFYLDFEKEMQKKEVFRLTGYAHYHKKWRDELRNELQILKDLHFLKSVENFSACQKALREKKIEMKTINFFDVSHINWLAQILGRRNKFIKYLYLTNLYDYLPDTMHQSTMYLSKLPMASIYYVLRTILKMKNSESNLHLMTNDENVKIAFHKF